MLGAQHVPAPPSARQIVEPGHAPQASVPPQPSGSCPQTPVAQVVFGVQLQTLGVPPSGPPPQSFPTGHIPHETTLLQPSEITPQSSGAGHAVRGTQVPTPQRLDPASPPPHVCDVGHIAQVIELPHPSGSVPHAPEGHVAGAQPQRLAVHVPVAHVPHSIDVPQPASILPQSPAAQIFGVQQLPPGQRSVTATFTRSPSFSVAVALAVATTRVPCRPSTITSTFPVRPRDTMLTD